jgi:hypothetical protein
VTEEELDRIEKTNDRLYVLYNACAKANAHWYSDHAEVHRLLCHLDSHFPGKDIVLLLREVRRLQNCSAPTATDSPPTEDR